MLIHSFVQLLPILLLALIGLFAAQIYALSMDTLVKVITDVCMPMLVFLALYENTLEGSIILQLSGASISVILILALISYIYARFSGIEPRSFIPAVSFPNSGFIGIPLMQLFGGIAALNLMVIVYQVQAILMFTLGVFIITGGLSLASLKMTITSPILWAVIGGLACSSLGIALPSPLVTTLDFAGSAASPLAAFTIGVSLREYHIRINRHIIAGLVLRCAGGFLAGLLVCSLFQITGLARTVIVVSSALPAAVLSAVLPLRYGAASDMGGMLVVLSTILGAVTIPITFALAG